MATQTEGISKILNKVKNLFSDSLLLRKVLFLPKEIEMSEILNDAVRLQLFINQTLSDSMNLSKFSLSFREYVLNAALWLYIQGVEKGKIEVHYESLEKLIPSFVLKPQKKDKWIDSIKETIHKLQASISHLGKEEQILFSKRMIAN